MAAPQLTHPTADTLAAFALGKVAGSDADAIASHLEHCADCRAVAEAIPDDSLAAIVRGAGGTPSFAAGNTPTGAFLPASGDSPTALLDHPRYRIVRRIGAGGMGTVFEAEHRLMERRVALKVINPDLTRNPALVDRFRREVKAAAKLNHPHIVTAHDAEHVGETHFLVMEFVPGVSLDRLVARRGPLPVTHACHYIRQAALGLQHAFEKGMVHRDLKPQNLMITPRGQVKVLDFGLARVMVEGDPSSATTSPDMVMGTPDFIAPEQARNSRNADIRADIYSLGCTLYYLLTGRPPFPEGGVFDKLIAHNEQKPVPVTELRPDVPPEVASILARMMAKKPDDRFQTPGELARALTPLAKPGATVPAIVELGPADVVGGIENAPTAVDVELKPPSVRAKRGRRRKQRDRLTPLLIGAGAIASLTLVVAVVAAIQSGRSRPATDSRPSAGNGAFRSPVVAASNPPAPGPAPATGRTVLIVLPPKGVFYPDFAPIRDQLMAEGFTVHTASTTAGSIVAKDWNKEYDPVRADHALRDVSGSNYVALVFVGGASMGDLRGDDTKRLAREMVAAQKPLAAVCLGVQVLAETGLMQGREAATRAEIVWAVERAGAKPVNDLKRSVISDGLFITGNDPKDADEVARNLVKALRKRS
jgi:serine/threonine-protein kinase